MEKINVSIKSEEDVKMKLVNPSLINSGWSIENDILFEHSFTDGRVLINGQSTKRAKRKSADYLLNYKENLPIAVIEAKNIDETVLHGLDQAVDYAKILDVPFAFSTNGKGYAEYDLTTHKTTNYISMDSFPTKEELWKRYCEYKNYTEEEQGTILQPYYFNIDTKSPRYYQRIAINRTVEAIAKGQERILLVMATGTGKTFTAFQIIHRLWKTGKKKKILFLADRNILVDQTMTNDFKPFKSVMTKIKDKNIDTSYEIFLGLYQQMTGEDEFETFKKVSPNFFDLIVIDECHRGSAKEESAWRKVLDYFSSATQIGLTATPKETKQTSNLTYFGEPIYTYSLKQGIEDGFLAPYRVIRVNMDRDSGYRPEKDKVDKFGNKIVDREYNIIDFDREMVLEKRTEAVAKKVTEYLKKTDRYSKTIIFCVDIDHAERMKNALVNENSDECKKNDKYVVRITGDSNEKVIDLENFIDKTSKYPVIAVSSKLMTTGVDAKTCKLVVLDSNINSMTEFKQIIGRGTRIDEEYGKNYFTILDFRNATRLFADPDFDGEPIVVIDIGGEEEIPSGEGEQPTNDEGNNTESEHNGNEPSGEDEDKPKRIKYYVDDVEVKISREQIQYLDIDGKLITENIIDYSKKNILKNYSSLENFIKYWNSNIKKEIIEEELINQGVFLEELKKYVDIENIDIFDLVCHIAYDKKPLTKSERARNVIKRDYLNKYSEQAQEVISILLDKYAKGYVLNFADTKNFELEEFNEFGSAVNIVKLFGNKTSFITTMTEVTNEIYKV